MTDHSFWCKSSISRYPWIGGAGFLSDMQTDEYKISISDSDLFTLPL